ncbi:unnamed protein product [Rotaria sordida]|uniref:Laccase n=1 Tax=Rotaria sordida TaxID=392033 RepID=A0A815IPZ7_9BILA|nr:unnamed protein product [Rotaria sordida]CAF1519088.1 unnamed protein product [Rotaria sordida]CAF3717489.1 unnamed protein product [Rotaria sordida]CAF4087838.1 unnamed protein product [Rotaria sordida]
MYMVVFTLIFLLTFSDLLHAAHIRHEWTIHYAAYNPDGLYRTVISINDSSDVFKYPGPTIRAQKNDIIEVIVHNEIPTEVTSIHWHGIHQVNTPWMDGVSYITQYPILPLHSFNYTFVANPVGTHWYHSHTGAQYADGLYGILIVEDPNDPYKQLPEFSLIMTEWFHRFAMDQFDILTTHPTKHHHKFPEFVSGTMNGKGRHNCSLIDQSLILLNKTEEEQNQLGDKLLCVPNRPYERFTVTYNETYRFRLIAAGSEFNYKFSIDNHDLTVIAIDGVYVEPYKVQQLWIYIGQRYDVLVTMNQRSSLGVYWIRAAIISNDVNQFYAILHYNDTRNETAEPPPSALPQNQTFLLNSLPLVPTTANTHFSLKPPTFNETLIIQTTCEPLAHSCTVNSVKFKMPHEPTLYTLYKRGNQQPTFPNVFDLKLNEHVMIVVNNFQDFGHPFHLHGHSFYVLGVGKKNASGAGEPTIFDPVRDRHTLNFINPPYRDTEQVPELSYIVIGFIADNPGSWLFHCHIAWDMEAGMVAVFNIGDDRIPAPPANYPLLINYEHRMNSILDDLSERSLSNNENTFCIKLATSIQIQSLNVLDMLEDELTRNVTSIDANSFFK